MTLNGLRISLVITSSLILGLLNIRIAKIRIEDPKIPRESQLDVKLSGVYLMYHPCSLSGNLF